MKSRVDRLREAAEKALDAEGQLAFDGAPPFVGEHSGKVVVSGEMLLDLIRVAQAALKLSLTHPSRAHVEELSDALQELYGKVD